MTDYYCSCDNKLRTRRQFLDHLRRKHLISYSRREREWTMRRVSRSGSADHYFSTYEFRGPISFTTTVEFKWTEEN